MKRIIALFMGISFILILLSCKSTTTPEVVEPKPEYREFEILYERVLPVIRPDMPDVPEEMLFFPYEDPFNIPIASAGKFERKSKNKFKATVKLRVDGNGIAYETRVEDRKVGCAEKKISMRLKFESDVWVELICFHIFAKRARLKATANGIKNPC